MESTSENSNPTGIDPELDELYEAFKPTLMAARRSYARKRSAALLLMPLMLGVAVSVLRDNPGAQADVAQLATEAPEPVEREERPDNAHKADQAERGEVETDNGASEEIEDNSQDAHVRVVELGFIGSATVVVTNNTVALGEVWLAPGWDAELVELGQSAGITLVLTSAKVTLMATISPELEVKLDDITPEPKEEEPEIQTRKEINVGEVGRVVVERDGDKLFMTVLWSHDWYESVVVTQQGPRVYAYFTNDDVKHHVEAWAEGAGIKHGTWITEPKEEKEEKPKEEEPEIQTRKEISVGDAGRVVVEREGETLWLGILSTHQYFDEVIVSGTGAEVHAYFTNDGFEHHVRSWIKGTKIKHETWIVEPEIAAYDGTVSCGFGNVGVLVEGNIARVMSVQEIEGIEAVIEIEVGEWVRVKFFVEDEVWVLDAFGNGEEVLRECGQVD